MRINMPVNDVEHHLADGDSVVSKTDLNGAITYVNRTFIEISGFSEDELIGCPHNMVRHPDMPPEAFADLWRTLKAGRPWKGLVKNRRKDGGYYWVEANANPIWEDGKIVGYMSLRTKPTRAQVETATRVYRQVREGSARGIRIKEGRVVRTGVLGTIDALKSLSIRARLTLVIVLLSFVGIGTAVMGLNGMSQTNAGLSTVYEDRLVPMGQISRIVDRLMESRILLMDAVDRPTPEVIHANTEMIGKNAEETTKLWREYLATYLTPEEKKLAAQWERDREKFVANGLNAVVSALNAGRKEEARTIAREVMVPAFAPVKEGAEKLMQLQLDVAKDEFGKANALYATTRNLTIVVNTLGLLLAIAIGFYIIRAVVRSLNQAVGLAIAVSSGDLTSKVEIRYDDEIGKLMQSLKNMNGNLVGIVTDVRTEVGGIAQASTEISQGNADLSARTQEQASALEETASSMEEMTSTVKQNADNARQANQLAVGAREQAEKGGDVVLKAVSAMGEINKSSRKIADIINVIDEIAFQTNLLALNAAVEAARAGEQGRGFAVVASEVRNLAQRSATAAKEIKGLINDSVDKVKAGSELVDESGKTLSQIVESVKKVTDIVAEIAAASHEQASGIDQVNKAVLQMDEMTQQNAALVEQAAAASRAMEEQARILGRMMGFFRITGASAEHVTLGVPARQRSVPAAPNADDARAIAAAAQRVRRKGAASAMH